MISLFMLLATIGSYGGYGFYGPENPDDDPGPLDPVLEAGGALGADMLKSATWQKMSAVHAEMRTLVQPGYAVRHYFEGPQRENVNPQTSLSPAPPGIVGADISARTC